MTFPGGGQGPEEGDMVLAIGEGGGAVVAPVEGVIDQAGVDGPREEYAPSP
jgi:hypothetical protein